MQILEAVKQKITYLHDCSAAYILAHAAWSACDHRDLPGPASLTISAKLDYGNIELINKLNLITTAPDYSNADQAEMLRWLHDKDYSSYVAKQVKTTMNDLIDWV